MKPVTIIGGGLAGCEAALQLAHRNIPVTLYEMKPKRFSEAHHSENFCELVCSNSFKSTKKSTAHGLLKEELALLDAKVLAIAEKNRLPGGDSFVINRDPFSESVTTAIEEHPLITIKREEVTSISKDAITIVATGPLTSEALYNDLKLHLKDNDLYFFDAISPIVNGETIDYSETFWQNRYEDPNENQDYLNCPMDKDLYDNFIKEIKSADIYVPKDFDQTKLFQGCQPIEDIALRGDDSLRFGPMKPVGLYDPKTKQRPYAVLQLRHEDHGNRMFNLVGFQTRLKIPEQKRIFQLIPALKNADFYRYGSIHRNAYINAPKVLSPQLNLKTNENIYIAGQLSGCEGYVESMTMGLMVALSIYSRLTNQPFELPNASTAIGSLIRHIIYGHDAKSNGKKEAYQPMNANYGLFKIDGPTKGLKNRLRIYEGAIQDMNRWNDTLHKTNL